MTEAQLKELLQDLATEAPPSSTIRTDQLHQRIGRRRKHRTIGAGAATLSAAVATAAAVVGLQWFGSGPDSTAPASDGDGNRGYVRIAGGNCGGRISEAGEPWLRVAGHFPAKVWLPAEYRYPRDRWVNGTVTYTNVSERARHVSPGNWVPSVAVRDGIVVAVFTGSESLEGNSFPLWPGQTSRPIRTGVTVKDCRHQSTLKPGNYEWYVEVPGSKGVWSGPWKFELTFY